MTDEIERLRAENTALRAFVEMVAMWEPYLDSGGMRSQGCHSFTPYEAIRQHAPLQHREGCPVMKAKAVLATCDLSVLGAKQTYHLNSERSAYNQLCDLWKQ